MTELLLSTDQVLKILRDTGALREGHFALPGGTHTNLYVQMPLAFRYFDNVRRLAVGLSRLLRLCGPVGRCLPHCTVVTSASGGIPVAFGVREALGASQIIWAERKDEQLYFRPTVEIVPGERCVLVDDMVLSGRTLKRLAALVGNHGGQVLAAGVVVDPGFAPLDSGSFPTVSLVSLGAKSYSAASCNQCRTGVPATTIEF